LIGALLTQWLPEPKPEGVPDAEAKPLVSTP
jgi:hypothetical protein